MVVATSSLLRDTFLLRSMNRQQTVKDLGILRRRILFFDQPHQCPERGLTIILCSKSLTAQPAAESITESKLRFRRDILAIQVVVAVRIKETVSQDGRCDAHTVAEQRL